MFYFLHVSKSAGSSFISLARNNLSLYSPNANGNPINLITGERLKFWKWSEAEQQHFLSSPHWQLVANENQMGREAYFFENVVYITIVREPLDRLFSAWQFAIEKPAKDEPLDERGRKFARFLRRDGGLEWRRNYLLSTVMYQDRDHPRERLELAKERLAQFDHVLLMENLGNDVRALARNGWTDLDLPWRNTAAPGEADWSAARAALKAYPDVLEKVTEANEHDIELYKFARELVERRKSEPPRLERIPGKQRRIPHSKNFEFIVTCAYEAHLQGDEAGRAKLLDRAAALPEASEIASQRRNFLEFALRRFDAPKRAEKEHRRKAREKKAQARAAGIL